MDAIVAVRPTGNGSVHCTLAMGVAALLTTVIVICEAPPWLMVVGLKTFVNVGAGSAVTAIAAVLESPLFACVLLTLNAALVYEATALVLPCTVAVYVHVAPAAIVCPEAGSSVVVVTPFVGPASVGATVDEPADGTHVTVYGDTRDSPLEPTNVVVLVMLSVKLILVSGTELGFVIAMVNVVVPEVDTSGDAKDCTTVGGAMTSTDTGALTTGATLDVTVKAGFV